MPQSGPMAPFTFAAGNAGKLLQLPLYGLGRLVASVVPRNDRLWVFGSGTGPGEGALPLLHAAQRRLPGHRPVWIAGSRAEARQARRLGLQVRLRHSPRGFFATVRARVVVVTHGFGDVNRFGVSDAFIVQLWHGIPLKRLHLDSPAALRLGPLPDHARVRQAMASAYRRAGRRISLFPVASELVAERIRTAFGIDHDRIVVTGDPRDDALFAPEPERTAGARALVEDVTGKLPDRARTVLYAPTWRDGRPDPGAPTAEEWDAIARWAEESDSVLVVRSHPLGAGDYAAGPEVSTRVRLLPPEQLRSLTPALPAFDVLVTDYSSVAFDFSLLERPTVFLAPDVEDYAKRRGLYDSYRDFSGGRRHDSWAGVLTELVALADPDSAASEEAAEHARFLRDEHVDPVGGGAADRVLDEILYRLAIARAELTPDPPDAPRRTRPLLIDPELVGADDGADNDRDGFGGDDDDPDAIPTLRFALDARDRHVAGIVLDGPRARVPAVMSEEGALLRGLIPLTVERWGRPPAPLPGGDYQLLLDDGRRFSSRVDLDRPTATVLDTETVRAEARPSAGGFLVRVSAPLKADEAGPRSQAALEAEYRARRGFPMNAVFFESFYSQSASDNPLGIDRALARLRPDVTRYWSVVDHSVPVPDGAIALLEGSREWWRIRGGARVLVVNDWLRKRFRRRPHQHVLQTWHGTMLKRLALDRPPAGGLTGRISAQRTRAAIMLERRRWDALLAQNEYSAAIFRSAYAMDGPIWTTGYPRNDLLNSADAVALAARVRRNLGAAADDRIVLYAPTWRDDRSEIVDYLDTAAFAAALGPGHLLLVRGHSRTLPYGHDVDAPGVVDATGYPDLAELLLVADVLITDYSSVMFDWLTTGRPVVFFTPDLAHYSNELRGFYFDLAAEAPGPLTVTAEETLDRVRAALADPVAALAPYRERHAAWQARFVPFDDGGAGDRVVARMIDEGWLPRTPPTVP